jgi:LPS export ABC transporter protein LptC
MRRVRVLATIFVLVVAALGIWMGSAGKRTGNPAVDKGDTDASAYDYEVRDVVVQQMGPDGTLQYELSAKQIHQQPDSGLIRATDLVMHRDPPGTLPGGPNRWTLRADAAELPESGGRIELKGNVNAMGLPENSRLSITITTDELTYDMEKQEAFTKKPVDIIQGANRFRGGDIHLDIKSGKYKVISPANGIFVPH